MKVLIKLFFLLVLATIIVSVAIASTANDNNNEEHMPVVNIGSTGGRFLAQETKGLRLTCDKFPRVCRGKGSPGPDCCKKRCVNVMKDRLNCGMCGLKCRYGQICCRGSCVNPLFDRRHCGGCNQRCNKGDMCAYGMCNYA